MATTLTLKEKLKCCIIDYNEMWLNELILQYGIKALALIDSENIFELAESVQAESNKMRPLKEILSETFLAEEVECLLEIRKLRALASGEVSFKQRQQAGLKIIRELFSSE